MSCTERKPERRMNSRATSRAIFAAASATAWCCYPIEVPEVELLETLRIRGWIPEGAASRPLSATEWTCDGQGSIGRS
jgi:hypothetical protein